MLGRQWGSCRWMCTSLTAAVSSLRSVLMVLRSEAMVSTSRRRTAALTAAEALKAVRTRLLTEGIFLFGVWKSGSVNEL